MPIQRSWISEEEVRRRSYVGRTYDEICADLVPLERRLLFDRPLSDEELEPYYSLSDELEAHPDRIEAQEMSVAAVEEMFSEEQVRRRDYERALEGQHLPHHAVRGRRRKR
jgi:hypothetical protein